MPRAKRKRAGSTEKEDKPAAAAKKNKVETKKDVTKMTVKLLKIELKKYNLDLTGLKKVLIKRLQNHLDTMSAADVSTGVEVQEEVQEEVQVEVQEEVQDEVSVKDTPTSVPEPPVVVSLPPPSSDLPILNRLVKWKWNMDDGSTQWYSGRFNKCPARQ